MRKADLNGVHNMILYMDVRDVELMFTTVY